jgi:uncharacterized membrane protein YeaQ/YmgE (transglycosylase-associated protein family)
MAVPDLEFSPAAQQWIVVILVWLGFGILAGLLAKALIPGREPAGPFGTLMVGVAGSCLGPLVLAFSLGRPTLNPISPAGILSAVGGAAVLLIGYRLVAAWISRSRNANAEEH